MLLASTFAIPAVGRSCVARSARSSVRVRTLRSVIVNNSNRRVTKTNRPTRSPPPSQEPDEEELSTLEKAALVSGLVATPVALYSEFVLKTTGCGLPPGPGGALGALEGVSYLVVVAILGLSFTKKAQTGTGLPAGPFGLLGAVEGFAFLAALAGVIVAGLTIIDTGSLPSAVPDVRCFGDSI